jgi:large subunit ribosomal protein L24
MKLQLKDKVIVVRGRDKGKQGEIVALLPKLNQVVVEGVNIAKRHTKPSAKVPRGGIVEVTKPIDAAKVMVIDPSSGRPARVGYKLDAKGNKERVFIVSSFKNVKAKPAPKPAEAKADVKADAKKSEKKS